MPELEWWKRYARAELRWFVFICDRIVSDAIKHNPPAPQIDLQRIADRIIASYVIIK